MKWTCKCNHGYFFYCAISIKLPATYHCFLWSHFPGESERKILKKLIIRHFCAVFSYPVNPLIYAYKFSYWSLYIFLKNSSENLIKDQVFSLKRSFSLLFLITWSLDNVWILMLVIIGTSRVNHFPSLPCLQLSLQ